MLNFLFNDRPDWVSATSVSSYNAGSGYLIVSHEVGHNCGAGHDFGSASGVGIMSYNGDSNQFSALSQSQLCSRYSSRGMGVLCFCA
tara:strand:+ start:208 stop:468 length:261 start_codon:yes stop_codon:yes gene_type:complete